MAAVLISGIQTPGDDWPPDHNLDLNALFFNCQDRRSSKLLSRGQNALTRHDATCERAKTVSDMATSSRCNANMLGYMLAVPAACSATEVA